MTRKERRERRLVEAINDNPLVEKEEGGIPEPPPEAPHTPPDPRIDYDQPESCPYLPDSFVVLVIGDIEYWIPRSYLDAYDALNILCEGNTIRLDDVDGDVGHTIMRFLYTGKYETLARDPFDPPADIDVEYRRSVKAYHAARTFGIGGLESLAKKYIENFSEDMPLFDILPVARGILSRLPPGEEWFHEYLERKLESQFTSDATIFEQDEFLSGVGEDPCFDKVVMRMVITILMSARGRSTDNIPNEPKSEPELEPECAPPDPFEPAPEPAPVSPVQYGYHESPPLEDIPPESPVYPVAEQPPLPDDPLYDDWYKISPKERKKRGKTLKKKGMPIPVKQIDVTPPKSAEDPAPEPGPREPHAEDLDAPLDENALEQELAEDDWGWGTFKLKKKPKKSKVIEEPIDESPVEITNGRDSSWESR